MSCIAACVSTDADSQLQAISDPTLFDDFLDGFDLESPGALVIDTVPAQVRIKMDCQLTHG
jgi:hypothetical protein